MLTPEEAERHHIQIERLWACEPLSVLDTFRDAAIIVLDGVRLANTSARFRDNGTLDPLLSDVFHPAEDKFFRHLEIVRGIWESRVATRILSQPEVISVSINQAPSMFDGSCYHEVALRFGIILENALTNNWTCSEFHQHLRFNTGWGDLVSNRLSAMEARIMSESQAAFLKWKAECAENQPLTQETMDSPKKKSDSRPRSPEVIAIVNELAKSKEKIAAKKITPNDIARKMRPNDKKGAANLLRQAKKYRHLWE